MCAFRGLDPLTGRSAPRVTGGTHEARVPRPPSALFIRPGAPVSTRGGAGLPALVTEQPHSQPWGCVRPCEGHREADVAPVKASVTPLL